MLPWYYSTVSISRLMALGLLAEHGPVHGHAIRREAEATNVETWGGVSVGALYRDLHQMEQEGLIAVVRSEQLGRRPARTVYRLTAEGRKELAILRAQAMREVQRRPDPLGVALLFGGLCDAQELSELLRFRRQTLENQLVALRADRRRLEGRGELGVAARAVFRRGEIHLEGELAWHREYGARLLEAAERPCAGTPPEGS